MGESGNKGLSLVLGFVGAVLVFVAILLYVNKVLQQFRKIPPAAALRFGVSQKQPGSLPLAGRRFPTVNVALGLKDVLLRKRLYATLLVALVCAFFILINRAGRP